MVLTSVGGATVCFRCVKDWAFQRAQFGTTMTVWCFGPFRLGILIPSRGPM